MPTWLVHGFRWPRRAIRIHIILQNLDDCAAEWLMAPDTVEEMTANFHKAYPAQMKHLPTLRFIEQYDPEDETEKSQPHAYVCDEVHEIKLGADIDEVRGGVQSDAWGAMVELRDLVAPGEKVGWFVVVNGDVERRAPSLDGSEMDCDEVDGEEQEADGTTPTAEEQPSFSPVSQRSSVMKESVDGETKKKGFKKWLGKVKKARSLKDLKGDATMRSPPNSPPLPKNAHIIASPRMNGKATA